jgi:hypothetical protein
LPGFAHGIEELVPAVLSAAGSGAEFIPGALLVKGLNGRSLRHAVRTSARKAVYLCIISQT